MKKRKEQDPKGFEPDAETLKSDTSLHPLRGLTNRPVVVFPDGDQLCDLWGF